MIKLASRALSYAGLLWLAIGVCTVWAAEDQQQEQQAIEGLLDQYYALEESQDYEKMAGIFRVGAEVKYRLDFGFLIPDTKIEFTVENADSFAALEDDSGESEDYNISEYNRMIDSIDVDGDQAEVIVKISYRYKWSSFKGKMKGVDTFKIDLADNEVKIASLNSKQKF